MTANKLTKAMTREGHQRFMQQLYLKDISARLETIRLKKEAKERILALRKPID